MSTENAAASSLQIYNYPRSCPKSSLFHVRAQGQPVFVHATNVAAFACVSFADSLEVEVEIIGEINSAFVRPLSLGIKPVIQGNKVRFTLDRPANVQVEINDLKPLHFYGNSLEQDRPTPDDSNVLYFKAGQIHEVGRLELKDNQTLYLEGGAVVKGSVFATHAKNIRICGRGVLDGSYFLGDRHERCILLDRCENVVIEDIILIEPTTWMVLLGACRQVRITNLKEIGEVVSSDGIDVVGSKDVIIDGCFLKNNDDCVVIKSFVAKGAYGSEGFNWCEDVDNILIQNCTLMNDRAGNAMEIGFELCCESVRNITFRNIDVIHVHGAGAVFSIHNCDRAAVSNILWEDIRIEHCWDLFLDFRVSVSRYTTPDHPGTVENVRLKNIHWTRSTFNPGYTKSLIGGWDETMPIRNVVLEDIYFDGRKITTQDEMDLFVKSTTGLVIK